MKRLWKKASYKRWKRQTKAMILGIIVVIIGFLIAYRVSVGQIESKYKASEEKLTAEIEENKRQVYVALKKIPAGSPIIIGKGGNAELQIRYSDQPMDNYMKQSQSNCIATVDISQNQPITRNMIGKEYAFGLREEEFGMFQLSSNLKKNDFVDIRIMLSNGENYIVLSKKCLKHLNKEKKDVYLWLTEDETNLISSAIVDSYLHEGTQLYTVKYIEDSQKPSIVTYNPTKDVMLAMANNPNIVEEAKKSLNLSARQQVDERLKAFEENTDVDLKSNKNNSNGTEEKTEDITEDDVYQEAEGGNIDD